MVEYSKSLKIGSKYVEDEALGVYKEEITQEVSLKWWFLGIGLVVLFIIVYIFAS